jgi:molybdenum cofactor cytidylyltransferase
MSIVVGGAILAAGAATRFGGDKLLVDVRGRSLLAHTIDAVRASPCTPIAVVLGARAEAHAPIVERAVVERLDNPAWQEGMAASVRAATAWAQRRGLAALALIVADQPHLTGRHLAALVAASEGGSRMAASHYAGVLGVPAVFPDGSFGALLSLTGDTGARALLRAPGAPVAAVPWPDGVLDIDEPERGLA